MALNAAVYAFDAITINLSLSVFAWALSRSTKAAIELHAMLDLRANIPSFIHITDGTTHEVNIMDDLVLVLVLVLALALTLALGAVYLVDRDYLDFAGLFVIHEAQTFLVTRAKSSTKFQRRCSQPVDRIDTSVLCDQTGVLTTHYLIKDYPTLLRGLVIKDDTGNGWFFDQ